MTCENDSKLDMAPLGHCPNQGKRRNIPLNREVG